ncbi:MAG: twin-arginine translocase TatA/TatE family subunit [Candidatus Limnocylindrales bacterium]
MPTPGPLELVIILVIALLILGPGKLPDVGSALGKSIREFRKASSDVQDAVKLDTSPLPATPPAVPTPSPAVAATASELPGAPTVASAPKSSAASSEPTPGTN